MCLGLFPSCMTNFLLRFSSQKDVLRSIVLSMIVSCPGPDTAKQAQAMILPPPCFTNYIRFLCWNAVFLLFSKHNAFHLNQKRLVLSQPFRNAAFVVSKISSKNQSVKLFICKKLCYIIKNKKDLLISSYLRTLSSYKNRISKTNSIPSGSSL